MRNLPMSQQTLGFLLMHDSVNSTAQSQAPQCSHCLQKKKKKSCDIEHSKYT